ncbi:MAG: peptidase M20, partial [Proteobacteria bacterium]|nr:peptidase M20 [Pseudomonadota bacterium]
MKTMMLVLLLALSAISATAQETEATRIATSVQTLASDFFEGRAPGTRGEERTVGY